MFCLDIMEKSKTSMWDEDKTDLYNYILVIIIFYLMISNLECYKVNGYIFFNLFIFS